MSDALVSHFFPESDQQLGVFAKLSKRNVQKREGKSSWCSCKSQQAGLNMSQWANTALCQQLIRDKEKRGKRTESNYRTWMQWASSRHSGEQQTEIGNSGDKRHQTEVKRNKVKMEKKLQSGRADWRSCLNWESTWTEKHRQIQEVRVEMSKEDSRSHLTSCLKTLWFLQIWKWNL